MAEQTERNEWRDRIAVIDVLDAYAEAIDRRRFADLKELFTEDIEFDYGPDWKIFGRQEAIDRIADSLATCGRTQHLLGNYRVKLDGDQASSGCYMRAFHVGIGAAAGMTYEMAGHCRDAFVYRDGLWKMSRRVGRMIFETGAPEVLAPQTAAK
jgi:hypothetical protein